MTHNPDKKISSAHEEAWQSLRPVTEYDVLFLKSLKDSNAYGYLSKLKESEADSGIICEDISQSKAYKMISTDSECLIRRCPPPRVIEMSVAPKVAESDNSQTFRDQIDLKCADDDIISILIEDLANTECSELIVREAKRRRHLGKRCRFYGDTRDDEALLQKEEYHNFKSYPIYDWGEIFRDYSESHDGHYRDWSISTMPSWKKRYRDAKSNPNFKEIFAPPPAPSALQHPASWGVNSRIDPQTTSLNITAIHPACYSTTIISPPGRQTRASDLLDEEDYDDLSADWKKSIRDLAAIESQNYKIISRLYKYSDISAKISGVRAKRMRVHSVLDAMYISSKKDDRNWYGIGLAAPTAPVNMSHHSASKMNSTVSVDDSNNSLPLKSNTQAGACNSCHVDNSDVLSDLAVGIPVDGYVNGHWTLCHVSRLHYDGPILRHIKIKPVNGTLYEASWVAVEDGAIAVAGTYTNITPSMYSNSLSSLAPSSVTVPFTHATPAIVANTKDTIHKMFKHPLYISKNIVGASLDKSECAVGESDLNPSIQSPPKIIKGAKAKPIKKESCPATTPNGKHDVKYSAKSSCEETVIALGDQGVKGSTTLENVKRKKSMSGYAPFYETGIASTGFLKLNHTLKTQKKVKSPLEQMSNGPVHSISHQNQSADFGVSKELTHVSHQSAILTDDEDVKYWENSSELNINCQLLSSNLTAGSHRESHFIPQAYQTFAPIDRVPASMKIPTAIASSNAQISIGNFKAYLISRGFSTGDLHPSSSTAGNFGYNGSTVYGSPYFIPLGTGFSNVLNQPMLLEQSSPALTPSNIYGTFSVPVLTANSPSAQQYFKTAQASEIPLRGSESGKPTDPHSSYMVWTAQGDSKSTPAYRIGKGGSLVTAKSPN